VKMAQRFKVVSMKKNHEPRCYIADIEFEGRNGKYMIVSDAKIQYLDWIDELSILDGMDCPFNGSLPYLKITGINPGDKSREGRLEKAFYEFIQTECSEN